MTITYKNISAHAQSNTGISTFFPASESRVQSFIETADGTQFAGTIPSGTIYRKKINEPWLSIVSLAGATNIQSLYYDGVTGNILAGSFPNGSVYRSTNMGDSFQLMENLPSADGVWSITRHSDGILYCGTGSNGIVYFSVDDGLSWGQTSAQPTGGVTLVTTILSTSSELFIGTSPNGDVFSTTNSGASWDPLPNIPAANDVVSLAFDSTNSRLWAGTGPNGDVFFYVGVGWNSTTNIPGLSNIWGLALDFDGNLVTGGLESDNLYITSDIGTSWQPLATVMGGVWGLYSNKKTIFSNTDNPGGVWKVEQSNIIWQGDIGSQTSIVDLSITNTGVVNGSATVEMYNQDTDQYYEIGTYAANINSPAVLLGKNLVLNPGDLLLVDSDQPIDVSAISAIRS